MLKPSDFFNFRKFTVFISGVFAVLIFTFPAFSQNKFEGYPIILDAPKNHQSAVCALRYAPAASNVTISDLNPATPLNLKPCGSTNAANLTQGRDTANIKTSGDNKFCFTGEDKKYRISYNGDQYSGRQIYDWIPTPDEKNLGFYNVKDFGALGDGRTDDTIAIQSALAFIGSRGGGVLTFPEGDYHVGNSPGYKGIVIPSGTTIQGVSGLHSGAAINNVNPKSPSRITLDGSNRALFMIGECTEKVVIKDIELFGTSNDNTSGIEAVGAYNSSQDFYFERVSFSQFNRGVNAYGLMQTQRQWQFDYIKFNHCRFVFNRDAGIYADLPNSDWKIMGSLFILPKFQPGQNADAMNLARVTAATIQDTYAGGFHGAYGGTYLKTVDGGNLTVIGSEVEQITNTFVFNEEKNPQAGNYSYPITFINNFFGPPIIFNARRSFVSVGNGYSTITFKADPQVRVYSMGDRFCYDGYILGCRGGEQKFSDKKLFDNATVIYMTGQPGDGNVPDIPTYFGTDVQFNAPVQMPSLTLEKLPRDKPNGSMVYCANCRRNSTPCQSGGSGAPAMVVGNQWSCL